MKFTKMQGCGNDYVYVNCLEETISDPEQLAREVSDRHYGMGSDGLILICPSKCFVTLAGKVAQHITFKARAASSWQ